MYRVLLVDDENLVLKSLEAGVDWAKSGFTVVGKANNGAQALQLVASLKPHIVFTDIRMPGISGLELIKQIQELDPHIQFIVISGFAEFTYVQQSLKFGVLGYCLKPFDDDEINLLLKKATKLLDEQKQKHEYHLLELFQETPSITTQAAFDAILLDEELNTETLYVLVSIGKGCLPFSQGDRYLRINSGSASFSYIVQFQDDSSYARFIGTNIPAGIKGIGIQQTTRSLENITKSIDIATTKAWKFFIVGQADYFIENDRSLEIKANQLVKQLEKAVIMKDIVLVRKLLDELLLADNKSCLTIFHALKIYNSVYFHTNDDQTQVTSDEYVFSKEQLYYLYLSFEAMVANMKQAIKGTNSQALHQTEHRTKNANLKEIIKYMNENYRNDISIQSISKNFYLNPNYLSQLFTKELQVTFTEYLTKLRLEQAKSLLQTTSLSISEIAEQIGFRDYFYFIRLFKKYTNHTPRQFKQ
ncbi:response regulator [Paenibacillus psychroresistens]|uniref:Response regulator n=1 Tax=Paenibacillus psychroresistens TaxID=1778678 RepID=A0A6B8REE8_9BACL|nr:response regulator [Paenibacillus psychroresistens]QGQ94530.1 response regulator [Paenibacillus psychroresistens]